MRVTFFFCFAAPDRCAVSIHSYLAVTTLVLFVHQAQKFNLHFRLSGVHKLLCVLMDQPLLPLRASAALVVQLTDVL